jgi:hypothetical protein
VWAALASAGAWLLSKLPEGVQALVRRKQKADAAVVHVEAGAVDKRDAAADARAEARDRGGS